MGLETEMCWGCVCGETFVGEGVKFEEGERLEREMGWGERRVWGGRWVAREGGFVK